MDKIIQRTLGAHLNDNGYCYFKTWAPFCEALELEIISAKKNHRYPMHRTSEGYFELELEKIKEGTEYFYVYQEEYLPDLAADYLPEGIFGPAQIVRFDAPQSWDYIPLKEYIIYELHVGTFSDEGTFGGIIPQLSRLKKLGITAIELMPVAQFSGERNWGYDGAYPYAVQNSYGGPLELKKLVQACHEMGISVILDVVYNHIGPEGNFFELFGSYFTEKYSTPWGKSLNFDDEYSHFVRRYFIENALHWFTEYGIDALRLDAVHAIVDNSAYSFLEELADTVHKLSSNSSQEYYLIAESCANDARLTRAKQQHGFGMHAQWNDEFHHALHSLMTGERFGYYEDFGSMDLFIKAYKEGFAYSGEYSAFRKQPHGTSSAELPGERMVVFLQNHDHIGNRALGERLTDSLTHQQLKLCASLLFFSPYIPLIFMGEEYAETAPFLYFISHEDPKLIKAVRQGRKKEFSFLLDENDLPDPQSEKTFLKSKLNVDLLLDEPHSSMFEFYKKLIRLRKNNPALSTLDKKNLFIECLDNKLLLINRIAGTQHMLLVANCSEHTVNYAEQLDVQGWKLLLDSTEETESYRTLSAYGVLIFEKDI